MMPDSNKNIVMMLLFFARWLHDAYISCTLKHRCVHGVHDADAPYKKDIAAMPMRTD